VASFASDVEGPGDSPPAFPGRLSDGSDDGQAASDPFQPPSSRLEDIWRIYSLWDLPGITKDILKAGWRHSTENRCDRAWLSFKRHLLSTKVPLNQVGVKRILIYIAHLHNLGLAFRTINLHRSSISMTLPYINGVAVGSHPLVSRMCERSFEKKAPSLRGSISLGPISSLGHVHALVPSYLLCPTREEVRLHFSYPFWRRLLELFYLKCNVSHLQISNNLVLLVPAYLSKTDKAGRIGPPICLRLWRED
jgi:hypothetical protein